LLARLPPVILARRELSGLLWGAGIPAPAQGRQAYLGTLGRTTRLLDRCAEILDAAELRGIRLMPYKGAALVDLYYGDRGLRGLGDLDLLVEPAQLDDAISLLESLGFRRRYAGQARFTPRHAHDVALDDIRDPDCAVELHYRLFHDLAGDPTLARIFDRAVRRPILGGARLVPAPADHLFAVAVHAAGHSFGEHPGWVVDARLLWAEAGVEEARTEAHRRGYGPAFDVAMFLLSTIFPEISAPLGLADRARLGLLRRISPSPMAAPVRGLPSLLTRAILTRRPIDAVWEIVRKLGLRVTELGESRRR